jgi:hypothetical protein
MELDPKERALLRKVIDGYRLIADVNGNRYEVVYSSRWVGDPIPWVTIQDPDLRFTNAAVEPEPVPCEGCGEDIGPRPCARHDLPAITVCENCAVAELVADLAQLKI